MFVIPSWKVVPCFETNSKEKLCFLHNVMFSLKIRSSGFFSVKHNCLSCSLKHIQVFWVGCNQGSEHLKRKRDQIKVCCRFACRKANHSWVKHIPSSYDCRNNYECFLVQVAESHTHTLLSDVSSHFDYATLSCIFHCSFISIIYEIMSISEKVALPTFWKPLTPKISYMRLNKTITTVNIRLNIPFINNFGAYICTPPHVPFLCHCHCFSSAGILGETISLDVFDHIKCYSSNTLTKTVLFFLAADMGEEFVSMLTELLFELHVAATPDKLNKVSTC